MAWLAEASPRAGSVVLAAGGSAGHALDRYASGGRAEASQVYSELDVEFERSANILWCHMRPAHRPSFTPQLLQDLARMQRSIATMALRPNGAVPQYYVLASRLPGLFNLGGHLELLQGHIRRGDRAGLEDYAKACIKVLHNNSVSFNLPVVTIALVQGDALGGGFEAALSCDVIVAEKGTRFGLPEVLFNLFPGMGAYSFLARRIGAAKAEKLILSGKIYTAEELYDMDLVQVLAEPGAGELAVREFVERNRRRHNTQVSVYQAGRQIAPITYSELEEVTRLWVDAALRLTETDLRKMERLASAQNRRWSLSSPRQAGKA